MNEEIIRRFEECIKILNKLDFDKVAYSTSSLKNIKEELLYILIIGVIEGDKNNKIDKLEQENKQLKQQKKQAINFIKNYMYENYCYCGSEDKLLEILGDGNNE